jgi:hypothetical protein
VYVLWVSDDTIAYARSTDCGATFSKQRTLLTFIPNSASDALAPEAPRPTNPAHDEGSGEESSVEQGDARDCGSVYDHRESGYTFFRRDSQVRASADQKGNDSYVYLVCDATIPGTVEDAETTYSTVPGDKVGQAGVFFVRLEGDTGDHTDPSLTTRATRTKVSGTRSSRTSTSTRARCTRSGGTAATTRVLGAAADRERREGACLPVARRVRRERPGERRPDLDDPASLGRDDRAELRAVRRARGAVRR